MLYSRYVICYTLFLYKKCYGLKIEDESLLWLICFFTSAVYLLETKNRSPPFLYIFISPLSKQVDFLGTFDVKLILAHYARICLILAMV